MIGIGTTNQLQNNIKTFLQLLHPQKHKLFNIHSEVINLDRLVKDLYELSMSDIGALSYNKKELNIIEQLQQSISFYQDAFESDEIELIFNVKFEGDLYVHADADRLSQLFSNLLANSLRYTDKRGKLEITVAKKYNKVTIEFNDTAPSVMDADLHKLFDRLFRVETSRSRDTGGSGLGLAICQNIVDAHQGKISAAQSNLGGLKIIIELPWVK